jgi:hypothetical protein
MLFLFNYYSKRIPFTVFKKKVLKTFFESFSHQSRPVEQDLNPLAGRLIPSASKLLERSLSYRDQGKELLKVHKTLSQLGHLLSSDDQREELLKLNETVSPRESTSSLSAFFSAFKKKGLSFFNIGFSNPHTETLVDQLIGDDINMALEPLARQLKESAEELTESSCLPQKRDATLSNLCGLIRAMITTFNETVDSNLGQKSTAWSLLRSRNNDQAVTRVTTEL